MSVPQDLDRPAKPININKEIIELVREFLMQLSSKYIEIKSRRSRLEVKGHWRSVVNPNTDKIQMPIGYACQISMSPTWN